MSLWQWSTTAANNATAATNINWQEGQAPSTVNDSARQMMADVAAWFQNGGEWLNMGDTPTYVNATQFTVPGNLTARYSVGRRVRASVSSGTVYGSISTSAFSSVTTVTLVMDGSSALDSGLSEVDIGILNPSATSIPAPVTLTCTSGTSLTINGASNQSGAEIKLIGNGSTTPNKYIQAANGVLNFYNSAANLAITYIDDVGNLTAAGVLSGSNITGTSDERLKSEWESLPADFVERLATVKSGTYARVDLKDEQRHAGVGAQSLRALLPEAVFEGASGMLSVAYGNAALVACVELAKEVVRLRALVEAK